MIVIWIVLLNWAIYHFLPVMRSDVFFAVRVAAEFRESAMGRRLLAEYRYINLGLAFVAAGMMQFAFSLGEWWAAAGLVSGALVQTVVGLGVLWWFRSRVLPHAATGVERRVAFSQDEDEEMFPASIWLLSFVPLAVLFGAAWMLQSRWEEIPARFAVHWGFNGQPDRWADKSVRGVYGILLIGLSTLILTYAPMVGAMLGARRSGGEGRVLRAFIYSMLGMQIGIAMLMAMIAVQPLAAVPDQMQIPFPVLLGFPIVLIGIGFLPMWWTSRKVALSDPTPDERWYGGNYYFNPADAAYMVRNRLGIGYSPNFGNRRVQLVLPLLLGQFIFTMIWVIR